MHYIYDLVLKKETIYKLKYKESNCFDKINKTYGKFFNKDTAPARETVEVSALPLGARVEISVIARK